jgi:MOSC domain-containing protein YiiM
VGAGDEVREISRDANRVSIAETVQLYTAKKFTKNDVEVIERSLQVASFPESWKQHFKERLAR